MADEVSAKGRSIAVGGDVSGSVVNVNASPNTQISIQFQQQKTQHLASFLGTVIVFFAEQSLSAYGRTRSLELGPGVEAKLAHNSINPDHDLLVEYRRYYFQLEQAYEGVEQQNADVRVLVRRRARHAYLLQIRDVSVAVSRGEYVRQHASEILDAVIGRLLEEYTVSLDVKVMQEKAHLAISLIVADALIDCAVLERPVANAFAS